MGFFLWVLFIVSNNSFIIILKLLFRLQCVTFPLMWQQSAQDVGCTASCFFLLWVVAAPSNIFLNKVGVGTSGVCSAKGRIFFLLFLHIIFCEGQVPSAAITMPVELGSASTPLQVQETKLVAFGTWGCCVWLLLLDERFHLLQWLHWAALSPHSACKWVGRWLGSGRLHPWGDGNGELAQGNAFLFSA